MEIQTLQWPTRDDHQQTSSAQPTTTKKQPPQPPSATHSPPSSSSSPTHEFSFTISLHPQYNIIDQHNNNTTTNKYYNPSISVTSGSIHHNHNLKSSSNYPTTSSTTSGTPPFAIDLSPADDIFFHGHLLPLHLLSHQPISPRSSTNSMDSFTLPIKDDRPDTLKPSTSTSFSESRRFSDISEDQMPSSSSTTINKGAAGTNQQHDGRPTKAKTFSFFRRQKNTERESDGGYSNDKYKKNSKLKHEVSQVVKRYVRMVRPFLSFGGGRGGRRANKEFQKQPYSFSGNLSSRSRPDYWSGAGRRGEFSAPASMRTSPTNSGLLIAKSGTVSPTKPTSDSTMEELQAAIQAAIAHCKNSISMEDKIVQCKE